MGNMGLADSMFFPLLPIQEPYSVFLQKPGVKVRMREKRLTLGSSLYTALSAMRSGALRSYCYVYGPTAHGPRD
jgi:hypothetical protein